MPTGQAPANPLILVAIIGVIFYFVVFKPEKKSKEEKKKKLAALKKNDTIITAGGIHGTVVNVKPATVIVRVDDNVKIEFDKEAIATVETKEQKAGE